jgi:hypothetical protein
MLLGVPALIGWRRSARDRHLGRRHFISFVGFTAALVAITAAVVHEGMDFRQGVQSYYSTSAAWKVCLAISGLSAVLGCTVAFGAGLFSTGRRRLFLTAQSVILLFLLFITALGRQGT